MKLKDYLSGLLGKDQKKELVRALKEGKTVIVSGEQCSGKTTLVSVLRKRGHNVVEDFDTYEVHLSKPLNHKTTDMQDTIV